MHIHACNHVCAPYQCMCLCACVFEYNHAYCVGMPVCVRLHLCTYVHMHRFAFSSCNTRAGIHGMMCICMCGNTRMVVNTMCIRHTPKCHAYIHKFTLAYSFRTLGQKRTRHALIHMCMHELMHMCMHELMHMCMHELMHMFMHDCRWSRRRPR
jgi:hypothetical protein